MNRISNPHISTLTSSLILFCIIAFASCSFTLNDSSTSTPISHASWDKLLQQHVDNSGNVNYKGFIADSTNLNAYLATVSSNHPNASNWSKDEQLAYWINAYNAFTIQLVIRHYPVQSIKDIAGFIPFVNSPWDVKFIHIEGQTYDLNNIEHDIIRPNFNEPRIHFALVCAAVSCPKLRNEAYSPMLLNSQLDEQAKAFFTNPSKNRLEKNEIRISKLLKWYEEDFTSNGKSIVQYIQPYSKIQITESAEITYTDYNWELNEQ